jgi:hypothetical protein
MKNCSTFILRVNGEVEITVRTAARAGKTSASNQN